MVSLAVLVSITGSAIGTVPAISLYQAKVPVALTTVVIAAAVSPTRDGRSDVVGAAGGAGAGPFTAAGGLSLVLGCVCVS